MLEALKRAGARMFGRGDRSLAVPVFDGPYTPNNRLEEAPVFFEATGLEDMAIDAQGALIAACGRELVRIDAAGQASSLAGFDLPIQALAPCRDAGVVVALGGRIQFEGGADHGQRLDGFEGRPLHGVNALHACADGRLLISEGSMERPYDQWTRDLLEHGHTGRILEYNPATGATRVLAANLHYCFGLFAAGERVLFSETWAHRVGELGRDGPPAFPLDSLPGYPSRLSAASDGGFWLSLLAGRTQLMEFILREDDFRKEMMRTVQPHLWYAPSLLAGRNYLEAQQTAGVMQMGIMKPWAPPRSYGLVVRLDAQLQPLYSFHSRAGGRHHGVVAVQEQGDHLFALSKGSGRILRLALDSLRPNPTDEGQQR